MGGEREEIEGEVNANGIVELFLLGMLLRWFTALYDLNVVEEEAFLQWKEDLSEAYPGKQRALFQVNTWLMWLQEAESEEEDN